jgi:hypothetical protein
MPNAEIKQTIPANVFDVFDLIHDYKRRLQWDTLLQKAYLEPEFSVAGKDAISVCQGKIILGGFTLRTKYITFERGKVAAVKMLNQPPFFDTFAASIRHFEIDENKSEVVYYVNFTAKPKLLRPILHPIMKAIFTLETKKRLTALRKFFESEKR